MSNSDKRTSLLCSDINYGCKKFDSPGPRMLKYCFLFPIASLFSFCLTNENLVFGAMPFRRLAVSSKHKKSQQRRRVKRWEVAQLRARPRRCGDNSSTRHSSTGQLIDRARNRQLVDDNSSIDNSSTYILPEASLTCQEPPE